MTHNQQNAMQRLNSPRKFRAAWLDALISFRITPKDRLGKIKIHSGRCETSIFIEQIETGFVAEIGVKRGLAKYIGAYNDLNDARQDGFTSDEIEKHVNMNF